MVAVAAMSGVLLRVGTNVGQDETQVWAPTVYAAEPERLLATPQPTVAPDYRALQEPLVGIEAVICAYWVDDCAHALRVFSCESGPDYVDGNPYDRYVGTAQIDIGLHGWRFAADPSSPAENLRVAWELYSERGWAHWPVCRYS